MKILDLGELKMPALDAQTGTMIVYGGKGMGKTNFGSVFVEELDRHNLRFSWIDPVGVAWGLKHSADGKGAGIEVVILGGRHGHIPIEPTAGAVVADFVVDEEVSVLIDISRHADGRMWTHGEKIRFVRDYCLRLFQRQGENRRPLLQVIDECGRFAPQQFPKGSDDIAGCLGAVEQLVELGRNVGVGVLLMTQRSARMAKSVSELADMMVAFRTIGPRSVDSIIDWFGEHVPKDRQRELVERLRQLPRGTALVVSPGWLGIEGEYSMRARRTFDSSDTPRAGAERKPSGKGAQPDLAKYQERMRETIEKAEAADPKELRNRIAALEKKHRGTVAQYEKQLNALELELGAQREPETVDVPVITDEQVARLESVMETYVEGAQTVQGVVDGLADAMWEVREGLRREASARAADRPRTDRVPKRSEPQQHEPRRAPVARAELAEYGALPEGEAKILVACAQHGRCSRTQISVLTGYKRSTRNAYIQRLGTKGYVDVRGDDITATEAGVLALGDTYEPLPVGDELRSWWLERLPEGEAAILKALCDAYPKGWERESLSDETGYKRSTRNAYIQRLGAKQLVAVFGDLIYAADILFD